MNVKKAHLVVTEGIENVKYYSFRSFFRILLCMLQSITNVEDL